MDESGPVSQEDIKSVIDTSREVYHLGQIVRLQEVEERLVNVYGVSVSI